MSNSAHSDLYAGSHTGWRARAYSKITRTDLDTISLDRLEALLGKNSAVTEPPRPERRRRPGKK